MFKNDILLQAKRKDCTDETILNCIDFVDMGDDDSCPANLCGCRYGEQETY
jgi:hypothetical protein